MAGSYGSHQTDGVGHVFEACGRRCRRTDGSCGIYLERDAARTKRAGGRDDWLPSALRQGGSQSVHSVWHNDRREPRAARGMAQTTSGILVVGALSTSPRIGSYTWPGLPAGPLFCAALSDYSPDQAIDSQQDHCPDDGVTACNCTDKPPNDNRCPLTAVSLCNNGMHGHSVIRSARRRVLAATGAP